MNQMARDSGPTKNRTADEIPELGGVIGPVDTTKGESVVWPEYSQCLFGKILSIDEQEGVVNCLMERPFDKANLRGCDFLDESEFVEDTVPLTLLRDALRGEELEPGLEFRYLIEKLPPAVGGTRLHFKSIRCEELTPKFQELLKSYEFEYLDVPLPPELD